MPSTSADLTSRDGTRLRIRRWAPVGTPWAGLLIVHGLGEHGGRYERTATILAAAGIEAWAIDLRGAGESDGRRADVASWSDFLDDVEVGLATLRSTAEGRPVVLLGHSMGGLIAVEYAEGERPQPDLLVLSSPALDAVAPGWQRTAAPILGRLLPTLALANPWRVEDLSHDPAWQAAVIADPLNVTRTTTRLGAGLFAAQARANAALERIRVPTYVTHGTGDPLIPVTASEPLAALPGVTRVTYPGLRHEVYNEPEGPAVLAGVIAWLRDEVARLRDDAARPRAAAV